jgi:hypothetical protein
MFRSTDEMMAKLRSLNLELCLDTSFSTSPLSIKFDSEIISLKKGITTLPLTVSSTDQEFEIDFFGYVPHDKDQKIIINIFYENIKLDITSISTFKMKNNQYVENTNIKNYKEICFNGTANLKFFKNWFECNILNGAKLYKDSNVLIQWQTDYNDIKIKNSNIFCIGDSFTFGAGIDQQDTWPSLLSSKTNTVNTNIGSGGLSADGCFTNTEYVLNNFNPKTIICLLPTRFRKIYNFNFLEYLGYISIGISTKNIRMPKMMLEEVEKIKKNDLLDDCITQNLWIDSCKNIIKSCQIKNVKCFISTWDQDMYEHIPEDVRLPVFPELKMFKERASDGKHPHKKHYEFFVDSIIPYIQ